MSLTITKGENMSAELTKDFINYFKTNYSTEDYSSNQALTEEDALLLLSAFDKAINKENADNENAMRLIKSLNQYNDYFKITSNRQLDLKNYLKKVAGCEDINSALISLLHQFLDKEDVECKSGISYSDKKSALKADGEMFDENIVASTAKAYGLKEENIKNMLSSKLEDYLLNKEEYVESALYHMHSLYSYNSVEK